MYWKVKCVIFSFNNRAVSLSLRLKCLLLMEVWLSLLSLAHHKEKVRLKPYNCKVTTHINRRDKSICGYLSSHNLISCQSDSFVVAISVIYSKAVYEMVKSLYFKSVADKVTQSNSTVLAHQWINQMIRWKYPFQRILQNIALMCSLLFALLRFLYFQPKINHKTA